MSGGAACNCPERKKHVVVRRWRVMQRRCNHSAFSGYRETPSDYSSVTCLACGRVWRTKAAYVSELLDATDLELGIRREGSDGQA